MRAAAHSANVSC